MSEEIKVESKHKLNKKFLLFAIIGIVIITIVAIASIVPNSAKAKEVQEQLNLGNKYLSELNYEQAEATYLAILEIDPRCEEAYIGLANVYIATEQYEKVEEILKKAEEQLGKKETIKQKRKELESKKEENLKQNNTAMSTVENTSILTDAITLTEKIEQHNFNGSIVEYFGEIYNNIEKKLDEYMYDMWVKIKTVLEEKYDIKLEDITSVTP